MTLRNRERRMRMLRNHRCDTKEQRKRNENVEIIGVTLRNREKRNENVEADHRCDTKEQREE